MPVHRLDKDQTIAGYEITSGAFSYAVRSLGLTKDELGTMLKACVRVSGTKLGNYRFHDHYFTIDGKKVVAVKRGGGEQDAVSKEPEFKPGTCPHCGDTKQHAAYDQCGHCAGKGCAKCDFAGDIRTMIPCQLCTKPDYLRFDKTKGVRHNRK